MRLFSRPTLRRPFHGEFTVKPVKVGICGLGTVGGGTFNVLQRNAEEIARRAGRGIEVAQIAMRTPKPQFQTTGIAITNDVFEVATNPEIDIVIELIGGYTVARELVLKAIENGKHVVTANKALIAVHGNEIFAKAREKGRDRRLRSGRGRWHPGDQGDPRRPVGQPHQLGGRDHQRHR
jgi:homoserine dehydrogenase